MMLSTTSAVPTAICAGAALVMSTLAVRSAGPFRTIEPTSSGSATAAATRTTATSHSQRPACQRSSTIHAATSSPLSASVTSPALSQPTIAVGVAAWRRRRSCITP